MLIPTCNVYFCRPNQFALARSSTAGTRVEYVYITSFPLKQNVSFLSLQLYERGIRHEIITDAAVQHLYVEPGKAERVVGFLRRLTGEQDKQAPDYRRQAQDPGKLRVWPLTSAFIFLGIAGCILFTWDLTVPLIQYLSFTQVYFYSTTIEYSGFVETYFNDWQWWRLITPAFIHFSVWHILFNGLAVWELGRRLEILLGARSYFLIFMLLASVSNIAQYAMTTTNLFGGLSGVLFGYLGLIATLYRRGRYPLLRLPTGIYVLAGVSLFAGIFNLFDLAFNVSIANGAHLGGLIAGIFIGVFWPNSLIKQPLKRLQQ